MLCTTEELLKTLKEISEPCPCKQGKFVTDEKTSAIKALATETDYTLVPGNNTYSFIYGKRTDIATVPNPVIISTHTDTVPALVGCYAHYNKENHSFIGTFDNMGTNAVALLLMKYNHLPDNVFFSFTADEESGGCKGAKDVIKRVYDIDTPKALTEDMIKERNALFISLDVTWEGYKNNCAFSLEGANMNRNFVNIINANLRNFKDNGITYNILPKEFTCFDEGVFYGRTKQNACSYCLPTKGEMHDMTGLRVKENTFLEYITCLNDLVLDITRQQNLLLDNELTEDEIEK